MKKIYVKPAMAIVKITTPQIMIPVGSTPTNPGQSDSRRYWSWDDDDE